jgi:hypothetical protein
VQPVPLPIAEHGRLPIRAVLTGKQLSGDFRLERRIHERAAQRGAQAKGNRREPISLSLSNVRCRPRGQHGQPRAGAAQHAALDGLDAGARRERHLTDRGQPFERGGKVVRQQTVVDGPYTESKDTIGGFSIVEARDLDEAVALSHGCPALDGGGSVEVRPVMKMDF